MDAVLVVLGVMAPLLVASAWAVWFLVAKCRQARRRGVPTRHVFRGQGEAVTVAEPSAEDRTRQAAASMLADVLSQHDEFLTDDDAA